MTTPIEIKKVDSQGRIVLPLDWRETDLQGATEVFVIKEKGFLKIIPKHRYDLTEFFDQADFGDDVEISADWDQFENQINRKNLKGPD